MKKTLLIGFEKEIKYPHLLATASFLNKESNLTYFHFVDRGYFTDEYFRLTAKNIITLKPIRFIALLILDFLRLYFIKYRYKFDIVVAVDSLPYIISSLIYDKVVLWSHDFVTLDQSRSNSYFHKILFYLIKKKLNKRKKIIIQSSSRLNLFIKDYDINKNELDFFIFPVSLSKVLDDDTSIIKITTSPKVLQIGGINKRRSNSHLLLKHYQENSDKYRLTMHGFFDDEILKELESLSIKPIISNKELMPMDVKSIVAESDIGFISYAVENSNFNLIAYASGQFVEFLRLGKPVIVLGRSELSEFVETNNLGIQILNINDLNLAINKITKNYTNMSSNCIECFNKIFDINLYLVNLKEWIKQ